MIDFKGHRIEKDIILLGVRWLTAHRDKKAALRFLKKNATEP
jgi:hypothetical protein